MTDRDQVAREVLTALAKDICGTRNVTSINEAANWIDQYRDTHYPAPAAPETVTVEERLERAQQLISRLCDGSQRWTMSIPARPDSDPDLVLSGALDAAAKRIAADARRIAEVEKELQYNRDMVVARNKQVDILVRERDEARRALDAMEARQTLDAIKARSEAAFASATTSQGEGQQVPGVAESAALSAASPAPIPIGAVVEVAGEKDSPFTWNGRRWQYGPASAPTRVGYAFGCALTALYRATHPVADADTVERVAEAIHGNGAAADWKSRSDLVREAYRHDARAALRALGYTIQEGA